MGNHVREVTTEEKIKHAEQRINELNLLINHWRVQGENEINDLLDPNSDLLSTLLDDALIRESIISHLEICYNYQIKQANDD